MSDEVVLHPAGELDLAAVGPLRLGWYTLAVEAAPPVIVIDLAAVTFADAAFVGLVVGMRRRQAEHGGVVRLRHPTPLVLRLLQLTGVADLLVEPAAPDTSRSRVVDLRVRQASRCGAVEHPVVEAP